MIDLHVSVEFPRGFDPSDEIGKHRLRTWAPVQGAAVAMARAMKKRVAERGVTPDRFAGYKGASPGGKGGRSRGDRLIATGYPLLAAPDGVRADGVLMFKSSQGFHTKAGVTPGSFNVSGGMWSGLSVKLSGTNRAAIAFRGRSRGYTVRRRGKFRAQGWAISNALKAWVVFDKTRVNVVQNTAPEFDALASAINESMAAVVAPSVGIRPADMRTRGRRGPSKLIRDMVLAIRNKARGVR